MYAVNPGVPLQRLDIQPRPRAGETAVCSFQKVPPSVTFRSKLCGFEFGPNRSFCPIRLWWLHSLLPRIMGQPVWFSLVFFFGERCGMVLWRSP